LVRPKKCRNIGHSLLVTYFKPQGVNLKDMDIVELTVDELEAIKLRDYDDIEQKASAEKMQISQLTFFRIYKRVNCNKNQNRALNKGNGLVRRCNQ
jgi:predicted DNA-binding protein (UPF0251 family)